jgi:dihydroxyacetone kinase phosphotransfer subunit
LVGIVIVSHSHQLAAGVKELADSLTGGRVPIQAAGGLDDHTLGTTLDRILPAIHAAWRGDGIVVLVDLGSSVLNATLALEQLPADMSQRVILSTAPLVEAAVLAAVEADAGSDLAKVLDAASKAATFPKGDLQSPTAPAAQPAASTARVEALVELVNPVGLHARPAARIVQIIRESGATVYLSKVGSGQPPVRADSLLSLLILNGHQGDQLLISAEGAHAQTALDSIRDLIARGFRELL